MGAKGSARKGSARGSSGFTAAERKAMKDRGKEAAAEKRGAGKADGEAALRAKIAELGPSDRAMATQIHEIVTATAPGLEPKTWYGMPAYAKDGTVVCFFQAAQKFKSRYATLGFNDAARLDDGPMWPTAFALAEMTPAVERKIAALVRKAMR